MKDKLLISFSGGRTSAFMTQWLLKNMQHKYEMIVVFANTGKEREETLQFVQRCDEYFEFNVVWVEAVTNPENGKGVSANVVNFNTASRKGEPFEDMIKKHGIPNQQFPHCSRELKKNAIRAYLRQLGWTKYKSAIGIRADEPSRLDWVKSKKENIIYPLADTIRTTKSDINLFWSKQPFDLELKSYEGNCDLCWKKSMRKLMTIVKDKPELADWWREMEEKYGNYYPQSRPQLQEPINFFRKQMTVDDIIEESQFPFEPARDESKDIDKWKQPQLWELELDTNDGCVESCEAF